MRTGGRPPRGGRPDAARQPANCGATGRTTQRWNVSTCVWLRVRETALKVTLALIRCRPAESVEERTENEPAPLTVLTFLPSRENVTAAIRWPRTVAFTLRPTQPEGPLRRDRPETTSSASTPPATGLGSAVGVTGGWTAGGVTTGGLSAGGSSAGGSSAGGVSSSQ